MKSDVSAAPMTNSFATVTSGTTANAKNERIGAERSSIILERLYLAPSFCKPRARAGRSVHQ